MNKVFAFYPPGSQFQRSEERCQASIDDSLTVTQRACNDLGYISSIAKKYGYETFLKDYPSEKLNIQDFKNDFKSFNPDIIVVSTTIATLPEDSEIFNIIKQINSESIIIVKGAFFNTLTKQEFPELIPYLKNVNFAVKGEIEKVFDDFLYNIKNNSDVTNIKGLIHKKNNKWIIDTSSVIVQDLDSLPFPDRNSMNNKLYIRPDTGEPMATIESSRGCPSNCVYCLTPIISGKKTRFRSPESIVNEIKECVNKHNIKNFFFRSDTFTINLNWVKQVCELILENNLDIKWVANSRVKPLNHETLYLMKQAGCWLIAFGFESGADYSLKKMKKGATVKDALNAVKLAKQVGLEIYGFFMIGFPWETKSDIFKTINFAVKTDCDYAEFHLATAFKGTELYNMLPNKTDNIGRNYFSNPTEIHPEFSITQIIEFRKIAVKLFYLRPRYIIKKLLKINNFYLFKTYLSYGLKTLKSVF